MLLLICLFFRSNENKRKWGQTLIHRIVLPEQLGFYFFYHDYVIIVVITTIIFVVNIRAIIISIFLSLKSGKTVVASQLAV